MTTLHQISSSQLIENSLQLQTSLQGRSYTPLFSPHFLEKSPMIFDFSSRNKRVEGLVTQGGQAFQDYVDEELQAAQTNWGIGQYMERRDGVLQGTHIAAEERYYHLGVDIAFAKETPLFAPLDGEIFRTGYSPEWGDYGYYCSTYHEVDGIPFYLFFGHLKEGSFKTQGFISAGDQIGLLGDFHENGQWFHHTHFQICLLPWDKDTPDGYCSERDQLIYRYLNPNPALLLNNPLQ